MPSNEQRREAAKRKLERRLERRTRQERRRKQLTIAGSVLAAVVVVGAGIGLYVWRSGDDKSDSNTAAESEQPTAPNPPTAKAKPAMVSCHYQKSPEPSARPVGLPHTDGVKTTADAAKVSISMETSQGNIGLTLNTAESPCTVNSFASLTGQGFFNNTKCHRMTTTDGLKVLQCGDPTGSGTGGPGYQFANEYPTDQYAPNDPNSQSPVSYKRGVIAMANAGPNTNGSQFFLVYGDSMLPPQYTIFGTIDGTGLATLDKIAAAGVTPAGGGQPGDGAPKLPVQINSMRLD